MDAGEVAGLIAAVAFVLLVGVLAVPLVKLGRTIDELTRTVRLIREEPVAKTSRTMDEANTLLAGVNDQVRSLDAVTSNVAAATGNAAALSGIVATTLGRPLVRVAAFSYGVRQALSAEGRVGLEQRLRAQAAARTTALRTGRGRDAGGAR
jgi:Bacterial protein of unknown function (DUF948)